MFKPRDEQIHIWRKQQQFESEQHDFHKATINGKELLSASVESLTSLHAELEQKAAEHKAEYDRLERLIQNAIAEAKTE
jgi:hypothetical protein